MTVFLRERKRRLKSVMDMKTNQTQKNIPEGWNQVRLGDVCSLLKDGSHGTHQDVLNGIPLLSAKDVKDGYIEIDNHPRLISFDDFNQIHKNYKIKDGDILVSLVGSIGKTAVVRNYNDSFTLQRSVGILRPKKDNNIFLYQLFNTIYFQDELIKKENKGAQGGVYLGSLGKIKINLPPLPEQNRIVAVLEAWDRVIEKLGKKIEIKKQIKKGLMQDLLTGKKRLGGFKDNWDTVELKDVCEINPKIKILPSSFVYIDLGSVQNGVLLQENKINSLSAPSRAQRLLESGDIIFQVVRPYQKNNLFFNKQGDYVASTGYAQIRAKNSALYLYWLLHTDSFVNKVLERCTGSNYPAINSTDLSDIEIDFPKSKEEQNAIAEILTTADREITELEHKLALVKEQKRFLLNNLIMGAIRTPETM